MALVQDMVQTGQRVGGTSELQVGEGRAEAPVGTTLALIDQAVKIMNSVHKRLHAAQAEEFKLIVKCFVEHPESFAGAGCKSKWDTERFLQAAKNCELVPQADPNTASMGQRIMKLQGLAQLQTTFPSLMDPVAICKAAIRGIGWANPQQFMVPPAAQGAPPPQLQQMQAEMKNKATEAQAKLMEAQAKTAEAKATAAEAQNKIDVGHYAPKGEGVAAGPEAPPSDTPADTALAQAKLIDADSKSREVAVKEREVAVHEMEAKTENQNRDLDRADKFKESAIALAGKVIGAPTAGESGKQVSTDKVGKKTSKIIKDVDRGLK
jgi:hypothetical protein